MPRLALHVIERLYEIDPPNNPLSAFSLGLGVRISGLRGNPRLQLGFHVLFNPGRWFSFVGYELARRLPWTPRPITQDPVPVYLPNQATPYRIESAADLRDRHNATCEFGESAIQFFDPVQATYTASHRLFARFARTRANTMYDTALVLGLSFLMHNDCDLQLVTAPGQFTGYLDIR